MISAVVLTKNEEKNIKDCLESLQWCDEMVVIDDYSNDKTVQIAQKLGAKVYQHRLNDNFAAQRNFGLEKAKGDWVLFVDADERVSPALRAEITGHLTHLRGGRHRRHLFNLKARIRKYYLNPKKNFGIKKSTTSQVSQGKNYNGFCLKRRDWFGGKWLKHGETAKVRLLRLARKNAGRWVRKVHEIWSVKKRVGKLNNPLLHYPHPTISDFLNQVDFYSTLHAQALYEEGIKPSLFRLIVNPLGKFFQNYFLRLGFLDGMPGLVAALMMSFHSFLARAKLRSLVSGSIPPPRRSTAPRSCELNVAARPPRRCFSEKLITALLFCYLVIFPFGQLTRIPFFPPPRSQMFRFAPLCHLAGVFGILVSPQVHLYSTDLVLLGLLGTWGAWGIWGVWVKKRKYRLPPLAKPIFCFAFIGLLSLGLASPRLSNREVAVAGLYWLRWLVYAGLYFVIFDLRKHFKWLKRKNLLNFLIAIGVVIAIFGLVQYFLWPNLRPLEELEWDPHYYRVAGSFLDPGFTGLILALTMTLIVYFSLPLRGMAFANPRSVFRLFSGLITYLALALTYSRASYLAYIVGIAVISWVKKTPKLFISAVLIGVLTLLILPRPAGEGGELGRTYSIEARIKNWQQSIVIARDHFLTGVGFNAYRYAQRNYGFSACPVESDSTGDKEEWPASHSGAGADSSLLFVLATTGIFGLLSYLWIFGRAVVGGFCDRSLILTSLAAVFTHSLFLNSLFYTWVMAWIWILLATESS